MRPLAIVLLLALSLAGCDSASSGLEGTYGALRLDGKTVTLTLKPDFTGAWETPTDTVAVRWEVKGEEVWLHAKSGGLLRGRIDGRTLHVRFSDEEVFVFTRN